MHLAERVRGGRKLVTLERREVFRIDRRDQPEVAVQHLQEVREVARPVGVTRSLEKGVGRPRRPADLRVGRRQHRLEHRFGRLAMEPASHRRRGGFRRLPRGISGGFHGPRRGRSKSRSSRAVAAPPPRRGSAGRASPVRRGRPAPSTACSRKASASSSRAAVARTGSAPAIGRTLRAPCGCAGRRTARPPRRWPPPPAAPRRPGADAGRPSRSRRAPAGGPAHARPSHCRRARTSSASGSIGPGLEPLLELVEHQEQLLRAAGCEDRREASRRRRPGRLRGAAEAPAGAARPAAGPRSRAGSPRVDRPHPRRGRAGAAAPPSRTTTCRRPRGRRPRPR